MEISSKYFVPREDGRDVWHNRRVRMMPNYSFPHFKDMDYRIKEHTNKFFMQFDIDAFYAQCEQRDNPHLRGKPVAVGGSEDGKGIVLSASYEARKRGVATVMSMYEALKICPDIVCLPCCGQKYEAALISILELLENFVPPEYIEQYSIDECFVDMSPMVKDFDGAIKLAKKIKQEIKNVEGLTVSAGVSYNKTYAKLAASLNKPDGFTVFTPDDRPEKVYPLSVGKIWGIGRRIERRMFAYRIRTIGELANANPELLRKEFGINGIVFHKMARGEDTSGIFKKKPGQEKSFSHNHTMFTSIYKYDDCMKEVRRMGEYLCRKLRSKTLVGKALNLTIRYEDLKFRSVWGEFDRHTNDDRVFFDLAKELYLRLPSPNEHMKARMFGMSISNLTQDLKRESLSLFEPNIFLPYDVMDKIKSKFGEGVIRVGLER
jgi:DNA polymerase-4